MSDATLFTAVLDKADPAERTAFLTACGADADQRRRVEALLAAHAPAAPADDDEPPPADPLTFLDPPLRPDSLGRLGHYEVLRVVGRGGFGIVFRAFDDVLQRVVAIKVLAPHLAATSPARQRFVREARGYAAVRHENVVQVHGIGAEPLPYLVMELVPGETLEGLIARTGPLPPADVVRIGAQVARGLAAAHAIGLVHRDVKPANVLIEDGPDRRVKLTDFGLARAADDASLTQSGLVPGTPMFMAPEQAHGAPLDHRADLFSLGSVLYTMATGRPPFRAPTGLAVMKRVCDDDPRPIRDIIPEVPAALCAVIARLHAKDPAARVQSAAETADLLAACLTGRPASGVTAPPAARAPAPARPTRARRLFAPLAAAAVVGLTTAVFPAAPGKPSAASADPPPEPAAPAPLAPPPALADRLVSPGWAWGPPENLGPAVNSPAAEMMAALTADEREIVFVRGLALWTARRGGPDEPFAAAEPLLAPEDGFVVQSPTLTGDGLVLAFAALSYARDRGEVRVSTRASRADPFGPPGRLPAPVNTPGRTAVAPVLSADGLTLVVTTNAPPAAPARFDLVEFTRPTRGAPFAPGRLLPPEVTSRAYAAAAWVSDDGRVLVRTTMDKPPFEARFHVRGSRAEAFGPPRALEVSGLVGEAGRPWLSADGARVYFHSRDLPGGSGDLDLWVSRRRAAE